MAACNMVEDYRETRRNIDLNALKPEFDLAVITQSLDSLPEPVKEIKKILEARNKRAADVARRVEANRQLEQKYATDLEKAEREVGLAGTEEEAVEEDVMKDDEEAEPAAMEPLCLAPPQALPAVDLSPLDMPELSSPEASALLEQLLATRQLFAFAGAFDPVSASPVLRVLFELVAYGDRPYSAYQQALQYYTETQEQDMGWVPQLTDFYAALTTLGYQPPCGHAASGSGGRKRSAGRGEAGVAAGAGASGAGQGADAAGGSNGSGAPGLRVRNLQCLLRLLTDLCALHQSGRLDMGFNNQSQAAGKDLLKALLRMLLDADVCSVLYGEVRAALEALMAPWDDTLWRRVGDDTAAQTPDLGPSHRATWRLLTAVQGFGERLRGWRQSAALHLLRKVVPAGLPGSSAVAGGSRRGQSGGGGGTAGGARELLSLLGDDSSTRGAKVLLEALKRPRDKKADYWRLLTILQCVQLVVWNSAYNTDNEEADNLVRWANAYMLGFEQGLRGREHMVMRLKVFLAESRSSLDTGCCRGAE